MDARTARSKGKKPSEENAEVQTGVVPLAVDEKDIKIAANL